jgi:ureidoacrylate peracid hydrolase
MTKTNLTYDKVTTALLVVDPYNDFISEGGKLWDRIKGVAEANNCVPNMLQVLNGAREAGLRVFYALHHRYRPGDYETWKYIAPIQKAGWDTDLDLQLKKHGIHQLIVIGLIAHTCIEATVRFAAELGYDVTMVKDATADYSEDHVHAALDINPPNYASAIVTTNEVIESISFLETLDKKG